MSLLEWLKIWSKFYSLPLFCNTESPPPPPGKWKLSEILALWLFSCRIPPPPPGNENCQKSWHFDFSVAEYPPPPPENWNLGRSWHFVIFQLQITHPPPPPPPGKLKLRQIFALCDFSSADYPPPPPRKLKLRQILALCDFSSADYPPLEKMKLWQIFPMGKYVWQVTTCGDFIQPG